MNAKRIFGLMLLTVMLVSFGAGCAKKTADSMPAGATKVEITDKDTDWQKPAAPESRSLT